MLTTYHHPRAREAYFEQAAAKAAQNAALPVHKPPRRVSPAERPNGAKPSKKQRNANRRNLA